MKIEELALQERNDRGLEGSVDCTGCRACCFKEQIELLEGDDPELYVTEWLDGRLVIKALSDSSACRYLGPKGCKIYDKRPLACKVFDCRIWYLRKIEGMERKERREFVRNHPNKQVLNAGKTRL